MKMCVCLAAVGLAVAAAGCKKDDPRDRPGFIDTTDPGKVGATMEALPKAGKNPTALGGPGGTGPGPGMKPPGTK